MNQTGTERLSRSQVETQFGIPGWAIAEITKRLGIEPQYARMLAPGKKMAALHAFYTPLQVIQIRADYDRMQRATKERRANAAKERFASTKQKQEYRSLRQAILTTLDRIEARQIRLEQRLGMTPTFTKVPLATGDEYVPTVLNESAEVRGVE